MQFRRLMSLLFTLFVTIVLSQITGPAYAQSSDAADSKTSKTIIFGIIGTDTSHAVRFTGLLNHPENSDHVPGGRVAYAFKGGSPDIPSSADRVDKYAEELEKEHGVQFVDTIQELVDKVDVVLLESVDGRPHLEQVRPVFAAKKPVFIDKPLAGSLKDALEIQRLAEESGTPCFSASSLRFFPGVTDLQNNPQVGEINGVAAFSPCHLEEHHPDLYWYGIHGVEILYTLMGTGCETVSRVSTEDYDLASGTWSDGRIGTFRGIRKGKADYGALVFGSKAIEKSAPVKGSLYGPLVREIMKFAQTGKPPVSLDTTVEMMAFMEAADESKRQGGKPVSLESVIEKAKAQ